jgi:hypothetical protein
LCGATGNLAEGEVEDDDVLEDGVEADVVEEDQSQDRDPHFVQACPGEVQVEISQEERLFTEIYR